MQEIIEFIDLGQSGRGRQLKNDTFSAWYNLSKNKSFGVTFANNIRTDKKRVKVGKIGEKYCFVFTDDQSGLTLYGGYEKTNLTLQSKGFIEIIFGKLTKHSLQKNRVIFELEKVDENIYLFNLK